MTSVVTKGGLARASAPQHFPLVPRCRDRILISIFQEKNRFYRDVIHFARMAFLAAGSSRRLYPILRRVRLPNGLFTGSCEC